MAKDLAKVYVYVICDVYLQSRPMFKSLFRQEGHGKPIVPFVLPMISVPCALCECIGEFENFKRAWGYLLRKFGESFAKALVKNDLCLKVRWPKLWAC